MTYKPKREAVKSRKGLQDLIAYLPISNAVMVEVGSYAGESARMFAASSKIAKITCVDPWRGEHFAQVESHFDENTAGVAKITKLKLPSVEGAAQFEDGSLDLVYLDGDHSLRAVRADIRAWAPKVRRGGWIAGHDYNWDWPGVLRGVFELLGKPRMVFRDSSWVVPARELKQ